MSKTPGLIARLTERAFKRALLTAYLATLAAIVIMTSTGALIVANANFHDEMASAKAIAALGFISAAVTGLIGVIGSFLNGFPHYLETKSDSEKPDE